MERWTIPESTRKVSRASSFYFQFNFSEGGPVFIWLVLSTL